MYSVTPVGLAKSTGIILNSKILVTNEMFGWVNIYSQALASVNPTTPGNALAWLATDWTFPASLPNPRSTFAQAEVLGANTTGLLAVPAALSFPDAVTTCTMLGGATLADPQNLADLQGMLNASALLLLGLNSSSSLDVWIPYRTAVTNSNSSGYISIYSPGNREYGVGHD